MTESTHLDANGKPRMPFSKAILIWIALCTAYAFIIPHNILTNWPALSALVGLIEHVFPAIGGFAKYSARPEVVKTYYATLWLALPFLTWWFHRRVLVFSKPMQNIGVLKLIPVLTGVCFLLWMVIYLMGFSINSNSSIVFKPVSTGGRGNAMLVALTDAPFGIGPMGAITFFAIAITFLSLVRAITSLRKPRNG
jgi:hypothetical protein